MSDTTKTTPKADVRFAITITDSSYSAGEHYRHFTATAYVLGVDKYGTSKQPELLNPSDYSVPSSARALRGLQITAQADSDHMKRPGEEWYAWDVSYDRPTIQLADAEEMLPVLRKIQRTMDRMTSELGRPASLAQFCTYAARALTSERQPFMRRVSAEQDYEGHGYRSMDTNALNDHLWHDAAEWRKGHGIDEQS